MELIAGLANGFIELFKAGAATFMKYYTSCSGFNDSC